MFKSVRVQLSLAVGNFLSGLARARSGLDTFVSAVKSGIGGAVSFFANLNQVVELAGRLIHGLGSAIGWLNSTFLEGAIAGERFVATLAGITGSEEKAAEMNDFLRQKAVDLGLSYEDLAMSGQQLAAALKGANGEVDIDTWKQYSDLMTQFQALRPDVPIGLWGRAISAFMAGDSSSLTRLLDINIKQLGNLSDETKAFMQGTTDATDQQLGQVTALAGQVPGTAGNALAALQDIANGIGATEDLVKRQAETTGGTLDRIKARWEEFTLDVGGTFLPYLEEALDKFISFIDDHQEEIDAFAEALGNFAGESFEKFANWLFEQDWEKIGSDISRLATEGFGTLKDFVESDDFEKIKDSFMNLVDMLSSGEGDFLAALQNIDWAKVTEALNLMAGIISNDYSGTIWEGGIMDQFAGQKVGAFALGRNVGENLRGKIDQAGINQTPAEGDQQTPSIGPQDVNVTVSVDDDGKLIAWVDRVSRQAANTELGQFISGLVGGGD